MELYSKPKKCSLYYNGFYVGNFYCNIAIIFSEAFSFSFKRKQRGKALFGKLDNNICLLNWL